MSLRRGIVASFADKYVSQIVQLATLAVMSRLLTPAEIGLYLVANTVILLAENFRWFGVGIYIVQIPVLRRECLRAAFTINLMMSLGIGLAIFLSAGPIARFYHQDELAHLLRVSALAFCAVPFSSPIIPLLQRELAFVTLAWLNVASALVGGLVTIGLGFAGFGPVSYVWGYVAAGVCLTLAAVAMRPDFGVFVPSLHEAGKILSFGGVSTAVTVVNMASEMLPRLAFGKLVGFDAAGLYGRALTLCQIPDRAVLSALQPVVMPAMAAHARDGGDLRQVYTRGLSLVTAVQWPVLILLALLADPVVRVLLGAQWDAAAPLLRLMAVASMALAPAFMTFPILVTMGRLRDTLWSSLISLPLSMLITIGAATYSVTAVAASLLITAPFQMAVALYFVRRAIALDLGGLVRAAEGSVRLTAAAAVVPVVIILLSPRGFDLSLVETALALVGAAAGWLAALYAGRHPLRDEVGVVWRVAQLRLRPGAALGRPPAE
jgi:O-antigen/teichoic acid export membrane protein